MNEETWYGEVEEKALAEEFCGWLSPMRDRLADDEWRKVLSVRRGTLIVVLRDKKWSRGSNKVRKMWLAERTHYLPMSYEEVKAEYDAKVEAEREAKAQAEADALGAETEVHDGDAPYAIADDVVALPASGVSGGTIDAGSTPLAGKPREVEQGTEPDEDASQPDAELPDEDATQAIVPTDAPDATALTPVAPADVPVDAPVAPEVSPTDEQAAGAMIGDVPIEEVDVFVNTPAGDGNAPAWGATVHRNLRRQCCALLPECHSTVYAGANAVNCLGRLIFHLQPPRQRSRGCPAWTRPVGGIRREHIRSRTRVLCTNEPLQPATHRRAQRICVDESIHGLSPSVACAP